MFERIYIWLLRLYPSAFRITFGDQALQLVRDRLRDERGLLKRLRLYFDLLADIAVSVPREFRYAQTTLAGSQSAPLQSAPTFLVLEGKPPTPASMALAGLVSLAFFAGVGFLIGHGGGHLVMRTLSMQPERQLSGPGFTPEKAPPQPGGSANEAITGSGQETASASASPQTANATDASQPWQHASQTAIPAAAGQPVMVAVDTAYTRWIVASVAGNLRQSYFNSAVAGRLADGLKSRTVAGAYDAVPGDRTLALLLTRQLRASTGDMHVEVVYSPEVLPHQQIGPIAETMERYRRAMQSSHCTIEKAEVLPNNIGYLKLNSFPDPAICRSEVASAMASLNGADALIFDLRDNTGGFPDGVTQVASYLFDHPQALYNPKSSREDGAANAETRTTPVAGNRLADKPVYVLMSKTTLSGAEQFVYNLKMLQRATMVGETTGGAAHAGAFHRIDDHFGMAVPEVKIVNPFGKSDWEGVGVEPDVKVPAADALTSAEKLAQDGPLKKRH